MLEISDVNIQFKSFSHLPGAVLLFHYFQTIKTKKATIHNANRIALILLTNYRVGSSVLPGEKQTRKWPWGLGALTGDRDHREASPSGNWLEKYKLYLRHPQGYQGEDPHSTWDEAYLSCLNHSITRKSISIGQVIPEYFVYIYLCVHMGLYI